MRSKIDLAALRELLEDDRALAEFARYHPEARSMFETYLAGTASALPGFPADGVTAIQFTLFDNAAEPLTKSGRVPTMKSRLTLHVKAWDRLNIDWSKDHHTAWEATACLRGAEGTERVVQGLIGRGLLGHDVGTALAAIRSTAENTGLYGVCHQRKPGRGSHWSNVIAHVRWEDGETPRSAFLMRPDFTGYAVDEFKRQTAMGNPLGGFAVAQARVAYHESLSKWATELR